MEGFSRWLFTDDHELVYRLDVVAHGPEAGLAPAHSWNGTWVTPLTSPEEAFEGLRYLVSRDPAAARWTVRFLSMPAEVLFLAMLQFTVRNQPTWRIQLFLVRGLTTLSNMRRRPLWSPRTAFFDAWMFSSLDMRLQGISHPASRATMLQ